MTPTQEHHDVAWPPFTGSWRAMARYVNPDAVAPLGLGDPEAMLRRAAGETRGANIDIARTLFEKLRRRGIPYGLEPYIVAPTYPQIVRHPQRLEVDAGTCVDFATLFAGLCLNERVAPLLVVGSSSTPEGQLTHHVVVVLDLDRTHDRVWSSPDDGSRLSELLQDGRGVAEIRIEHALADLRSGRFVPIDPTLAARRSDKPSLDFDAALTETKEGFWAHLTSATWIDVVIVHETDGLYRPPPPELRTVLTRRVPASRDFEDLSDERVALLRTLKSVSGVVALVGEPGVGKSMLALEATGAFGWFLNASSPATLRQELAAAEAQEQTGTSTSEVGVADEPDLIAQAFTRLAATHVPWTVVLDNANLAGGERPDDLLAIVPPPRHEYSQRLLVTSTEHDAWKGFADRVEVVAPLDDEALGVPPELLINGRPLFDTAFRRLAHSHGSSLEVLASTVAQADEPVAAAQDALWLCAVSLLSSTDLGRSVLRLAEHAAWANIDDIDGESLSSAAASRPGAFTGLLASGLVEPIGGGRAARMHRLIAETIRRASFAADWRATTTAATRVVRSGAIRLDREGTAEVRALEPLVAARATAAGDVELLGGLLHAIGTRLEPVAGVREAHPYFERALPLLSPMDARRRADCLHAAVRYRYQFEKNVASMEAALEDVDACLVLRSAAVEQSPADAEVLVEQQRTVALRGLVKVELARQRLEQLGREVKPDYEAALRLALEGSDEIDRSYHHRLEVLHIPPDDVDVLRARFNQATAGVVLAQLVGDPESVDQYLDIAERAYVDVRDARETLRPKVRPHLASCHAGLALVEYLRFVRGRGDGGRLRDATHHLAIALDLREEIEEADRGEIAKTMHLAAKINLARLLLSEPDSDKRRRAFAALRAQIEDELRVVAECWWGEPA